MIGLILSENFMISLYSFKSFFIVYGLNSDLSFTVDNWGVDIPLKDANIPRETIVLCMQNWIFLLLICCSFIISSTIFLLSLTMVVKMRKLFPETAKFFTISSNYLLSCSISITFCWIPAHESPTIALNSIYWILR